MDNTFLSVGIPPCEEPTVRTALTVATRCRVVAVAGIGDLVIGGAKAKGPRSRHH